MPYFKVVENPFYEKCPIAIWGTNHPPQRLNLKLFIMLSMWRLERVWAEHNRRAVLLVSGTIILVVAVADWWTKPYVSLDFLYLFPIMLAAGFLPRWLIAALGVGCAVLSAVFSSLEWSTVHFVFESLALAGCGLFVAELVRNRRLTLEVQAKTLEGEKRLKALVETSPAAIVTIDERGFIELANRAADELMAPRDGDLIGNPIAVYLPDLHRALRWEETPQFRATMQCQGHRGNGELFTADVWFSTYKEGLTPKLAAIIADVTEEGSPSGTSDSSHPECYERISFNSRDLDVLRFLVQGLSNKEIAVCLEVSESIVKNTLQQLFAKTNVRTRSQLVRVAIEQYRDLLWSGENAKSASNAINNHEPRLPYPLIRHVKTSKLTRTEVVGVAHS